MALWILLLSLRYLVPYGIITGVGFITLKMMSQWICGLVVKYRKPSMKMGLQGLQNTGIELRRLLTIGGFMKQRFGMSIQHHVETENRFL